MNNETTRRDFLKTLAVAGIGSVAAAASAAPVEPAGDAEPAVGKVPRRPFGKTGVDVSALALGGMFDIPNNQLLMNIALTRGVTYWDTADCYEGGRSEEGIGKLFAAKPDARKDIFLVSKSDSRDPAGMTKLLDRSLDRMKTNFIDLYFIHGAGSIDELTPEIKAWAEDAKKSGKIKFFGFSTHKNMDECLAGAAKLGWVDGIMFTYNYRLAAKDEMKRAIDDCVKAGIGLTAMKTQGGGQVKTNSPAELELAGQFLDRGFTEAQAKIKAVWEDQRIASICSQMPNLSILTSNIAASLNVTKLTARDLELLEQHARETCSGYCAGCASLCEGALGHAAPVGDVMRYLMYYHSHGDRDLAKSQFRLIPEAVRARLGELNYSAAERACPHGLAIAQLMREATELLEA